MSGTPFSLSWGSSNRYSMECTVIKARRVKYGGHLWFHELPVTTWWSSQSYESKQTRQDICEDSCPWWVKLHTMIGQQVPLGLLLGCSQRKNCQRAMVVSLSHCMHTLTMINNRRWTWLFIHNFLPQMFEERMKHNAPTMQLLTQNHCKMWKTVHTRLRIPFWHSIFKFEMPISIAKCQITCLICCGHDLDWPNLEVKRCK